MAEFSEKTDDANSAVIEKERMLSLIWKMLSSPTLPEDFEIPADYMEQPLFHKIADFLLDLRKLSSALHKGELSEFVYSKGYILSNLKALQSNLRHLTWQTRKIADGDFSQKVDFLGDFSNSFNEMAKKLEDYSGTLKKLANIDALTQVPNRLYLNDFLEQTFEQFKVNEAPFCVMEFDIDFFKNVNDTYGHAAGDQVLYQFSKLLHSFFRSSDLFARYGGEEFVAVLPGASIALARTRANQVLEAVRKTPFDTGTGVTVDLTVSIGVSEALPGDASWEDALQRSDQALYTAKNNGRNQYAVH